MKEVIKTIPVEDGKLYALAGENRYLLADCGASIDVVAYEARRRGYDVEALPNSEEYRWGKNGEYTSPLEAWFSIIKFTENGSWKGPKLLCVDDKNFNVEMINNILKEREE